MARETQKLLASDWRPGDLFGASVALAESTLVIGAESHHHGGQGSGSAYVFERDDAGNWREVAELLASDRENDRSEIYLDHFGSSAAISGETMVLGAPYDDDPELSGSAYVFERDGSGVWSEVAKLRSFEGAAFTDRDLFGIGVTICGETVVVGAPQDDEVGLFAGAAYVFERNETGAWTGVAKLRASDGAAFERFGYSVALAQERLVVGAHADSESRPFTTARGAAYIFERDETGDWSEVAKLRPSTGNARDEFGRSVAISGETVMVAAALDDQLGVNSGAVYVFERDQTGRWSEAAKLLASDGATSTGFGGSLAISGTTLLVGAPYDDDLGSASGSAYLFRRDQAGAWTQRAKLLASEGDAFDEFGHAVALLGEAVVVGAWAEGRDNRGSAYVFAPER